MASLKTAPGSSTTAQHKRLYIAARDRGLSRDQLKDMLGAESLKELSAHSASEAITKLTGDELPNPPGEKPSTYPRCKTPGATRIISPDQVQQIHRLAMEYFNEQGEAAKAWLIKNFKVDDASKLATAQRAGEVIGVLKAMIERTK